MSSRRVLLIWTAGFFGCLVCHIFVAKNWYECLTRPSVIYTLLYLSDFIFYCFSGALFTMLQPQWPCFSWTPPSMCWPRSLCTCYFLCLEYFSPHILMATPIISSATCLNNTSARVIFKIFLNWPTSTVKGTEQNQVLVDPCWARNSSFNSFIVGNVPKEGPGQTIR